MKPMATENLLSEQLSIVDRHELRLMLNNDFGGPGQTDGDSGDVNRLYLPEARDKCRVVLTFKDGFLNAIQQGPAFSPQEWAQFLDDVSGGLRGGPGRTGREYSFSGRRVHGSWRGTKSGVQILPPPETAPRAGLELADHPFILEFPIEGSPFEFITSHRRIREHRRVTLLLNVLLLGGATMQESRGQHFWASIPPTREPKRWTSIFCGNAAGSEPVTDRIEWVLNFFDAPLGPPIVETLSAPGQVALVEQPPDEYYSTVGNDGTGLRVPSDLDESIVAYQVLEADKREKFDRAMFWFHVASRQWTTSMSASFASLVSAIEALTDRGDSHDIVCPKCGEQTQHETPGATRRFRDFLERFAPGASVKKRRDEMYGLRSGVLHGSRLVNLDQDRAFGWDPPNFNELQLYYELWGVTRTALRNWLKKPSPNPGVAASRDRPE
jgi:hypothetical protein